MTPPDRLTTKEIYVDKQHPDPSPAQPDPTASSDGDGPWTEAPITQDPHQDRSVERVMGQTHEYGDGDATDEG